MPQINHRTITAELKYEKSGIENEAEMLAAVLEQLAKAGGKITSVMVVNER